jgi:hypothetical protein
MASTSASRAHELNLRIALGSRPPQKGEPD